MSIDAAVDRASLPGSIVIQPEPDRLTLCLSGEIDGAVVAAFTQRLSDDRLTATGPARGSLGLPVVAAIDAGAVTFIDSAGLVFLAGCARASHDAGQPLVLLSSSPSLDRVLARTALTEMFKRPAGAASGSRGTVPVIYTAWRGAPASSAEGAGAAHAVTVGAGQALCGVQVTSLSALPWPPAPEQIGSASMCRRCTALAV